MAKKRKLGKYGKAVKKYIGKGTSKADQAKNAANRKKTATMRRIRRNARRG
jgi:hypothetical protein